MVFEKVREVIKNNLKVDESKITLESKLDDDLGADSIDAVDIIMALEDMFSIVIPDDDIQNVKTVGDLVTYIESVLK